MHRSILFLGFLSVVLSLQAVHAQQVASTTGPATSSTRDSSQLAVVVAKPQESLEAKPAAAPNAPVATPEAASKAEWVKLNGSVLNERNEPLAGATVYIKEAADVVSTNARGEFTMSVPQGLNTLVFSYTGYQEQQLKATNFLPVTVKLQPARRRNK
ncbi:CarboxypepD_reg-like domain-containing protein [Hymenobacter gelipurpurascens]|uniref:CarboxypepD_reg-like domain-containing protein n=1 Tax=Hymenobacter gelipurpurascens TaxID=89968 RepID=A0A212TI15_9BACT|nr:carboxypeptidase-like regulatory domain-containing protein [Hymenobacter gelipurpurascens]SNC65688.1 CarboxypepD_reg-like domain-containing protein [Hymenobacter gelipurpurascens]